MISMYAFVSLCMFVLIHFDTPFCFTLGHLAILTIHSLYFGLYCLYLLMSSEVCDRIYLIYSLS